MQERVKKIGEVRWEERMNVKPRAILRVLDLTANNILCSSICRTHTVDLKFIWRKIQLSPAFPPLHVSLFSGLHAVPAE